MMTLLDIRSSDQHAETEDSVVSSDHKARKSD